MGSLIIGQFPEPPAEGEALRWYAMRAFYNRAKPFEQALKKAGIDVFVPPMPSLFFIRATARYIRELKRIYYDSLMFYAEPGTSDPAAVKDREMEMFRLVCSTPLEYLKFFDEDFLAKCKVGQKVRVTGGIYKGAEGYIKRIKKDRRLLVRIEGVAVVATGFIPPAYLEPVD